MLDTQSDALENREPIEEGSAGKKKPEAESREREA
jgi:hypothetical protein